MTLLDQIMNGRKGEAEIRAAFRKSPTRKPITDQGPCPEGYTRIEGRDVRNDQLPVQGRMSADGQYACYEVTF